MFIVLFESNQVGEAQLKQILTEKLPNNSNDELNSNVS